MNGGMDEWRDGGTEGRRDGGMTIFFTRRDPAMSFHAMVWYIAAKYGITKKNVGKFRQLASFGVTVSQ